MPRIGSYSPAEQYLFDQGVISRRSIQRQAIVGCIGCRWLKTEEAGGEARCYGLELVQCTGIKSGTLYPILHQLAEEGVIAAEIEERTSPGKPRTYYYPADSEVGYGFRGRLERPMTCDLEEVDQYMN